MKLSFHQRPSQKAFITALCLLYLAFSLAACTLDGRSRASAPVPLAASSRREATSRTAAPAPPRMSEAAISYGWRLLDGRRVSLADYRGQVVVLDFYGTWCPPCREEIPHLVDLQKRYGKQGLNIIGLNVGDQEDKMKVPAFVEELDIQYALGDPEPELVDLFMADNDSIPQTFIFDRNGQFVKRFIGYDNTMPTELESVIKAVISDE